MIRLDPHSFVSAGNPSVRQGSSPAAPGQFGYGLVSPVTYRSRTAARSSCSYLCCPRVYLVSILLRAFKFWRGASCLHHVGENLDQPLPCVLATLNHELGVHVIEPRSLSRHDITENLYHFFRGEGTRVFRFGSIVFQNFEFSIYFYGMSPVL